MWTAYTRETPARPGWALATMAMALAATLALAQMQVSRHRLIDLSLGEPIIHPNWPVRYALPAACTWERVDSNQDLITRIINFGMGRLDAAYLGEGLQGGPRYLVIACRIARKSEDLRTIAASDFDLDARRLSDYAPSKVSHGYRVVREKNLTTSIESVLRMPSGVVVYVGYHTPSGADREMPLYDAICRSLTPVDAHLP